jgi:DNA-binding MarR family transcriptional regulator
VPRQYYKAATYRAHSSIGYLIKRAHSLLTRLTEPVLERHGFSNAQYVTLMLVRDEIAVTPGDICRQYLHDSGALTRIIDQLAERGLLTRLRRDRDRRKVELQLTAAGRDAIDTLLPSVVETRNLALADFSVAEVQELTRLLRKLTARLEATVEPPAPAAVGALDRCERGRSAGSGTASALAANDCFG